MNIGKNITNFFLKVIMFIKSSKALYSGVDVDVDIIDVHTVNPNQKPNQK